MDWFQSLCLVVMILVLGVYLSGLGQRVKAIKNQVARQSMTFLKIENDIEALHLSLLKVSSKDPELYEELLGMFRAKKARFKRIVENGSSAPEIMRGLEEPDIDDDPKYWSENRMSTFGFDNLDGIDELSLGEEDIKR